MRTGGSYTGDAYGAVGADSDTNRADFDADTIGNADTIGDANVTSYINYITGSRNDA